MATAAGMDDDGSMAPRSRVETRGRQREASRDRTRDGVRPREALATRLDQLRRAMCRAFLAEPVGDVALVRARP